MKIDSVNILGVSVARMALNDVLDWVRIMVEQGKPRHIVTANAEIIYKAHKEPAFMELIKKADLLIADGSGVIWASKILGDSIPERVTGVDLTEQIFCLAEDRDWGIYFLGARPEVVEKAVLNTLSRHTKLKVAGYQHGYYSQEETETVLSNITSVKPDILLVAMGVPGQEQFIQKYIKELNVPVALGVGGTFDILAGTATRAPRWMQERGLEWLYRFYKEPSRYKRMLTLPKFALRVLWQGILSRLGSK